MDDIVEADVAVRSVRTVGPDTVAVELATPAGFDARPGQFVQVSAAADAVERGSASDRTASDDERVARHYTLSSSDVTETFEVTVGVDPEGEFGPWLAAREAGDEVRVKGPFGREYYEDEDRVVVVAGGPGVGPAVGIAERALADGGEAAVVYVDDAPAHEDRLAALSAGGATVFVLSGESGLGEAVGEALDSVPGQAFVYGFADFLEAAFDALTAAGYDSDDAKAENFG